MCTAMGKSMHPLIFYSFVYKVYKVKFGTVLFALFSLEYEQAYVEFINTKSMNNLNWSK